MNIIEKFKNKLPANTLLKMIRFWPPYLGAGIKVTNISDDFLKLDVEMNLTWYNKNFVGTHFGGSLFSMTDPFYMLMLIKSLGSEYIIWDKASKIEFMKPGVGIVKAHFEFTSEELEEIKHNCQNRKKHLFNKEVYIFDDKGELIAKVEKTLYVKKK
jgi:acyl-coenzyme A thioesterase PaaI-like protein